LFATGINNASDTGGNFVAGFVDTGGKFATGVPVVHLKLRISPRIFEKI
jgi:hypothetical protein